MSQDSTLKLSTDANKTTKCHNNCVTSMPGRATATVASIATLPSASTSVQYDNVTVPHVTVAVTPCKRKKSHDVPTMNHPNCVLPERTVQNPYKKQSTSPNLELTTTITTTMYTKNCFCCIRYGW